MKWQSQGLISRWQNRSDRAKIWFQDDKIYKLDTYVSIYLWIYVVLYTLWMSTMHTLSIYIYIYINKTETSETLTIFYISTIFKKKKQKQKKVIKLF